MASSSRGSLTLFPDLNEAIREITGAVVLEPQPNDLPPSLVRSYPKMTVEQLMVTQSDIEANLYTLKVMYGDYDGGHELVLATAEQDV